jgi:GNAT superfamily N-acetyltransferase
VAGRPDNCLLVAEVAEAICGIGAIRQSGDLDLCYVDPGYQRRGIGRALVLAMESQARMWDVQKIRLISTGSARAFYEKSGYVFVPEESGPAYGFLYDYRYAKPI